MTIRDTIKLFQAEVRDTDLMPERAAEILAKSSALFGNINDTIRERGMIYNKKLLEVLDSEKSVAKAKVIAETTEEYNSYLEAKNTKEALLELIRSLKYFLRAKEEEFKTSQFQ
jgi:hypothetical protein